MRLAELAELRTAVEAAIAELASARIDDDGADRLRDAVVVETTASDADLVPAIHGLHAAVASAAGNRVLELVALVLIRLTRLRQVERLARPARREIQAEVLRAHRGIAAAVEAGDAAAARRRMQRHLEALGAVMRSGER
jgi:DNA-binding FadR family transcriptional regulator